MEEKNEGKVAERYQFLFLFLDLLLGLGACKASHIFYKQGLDKVKVTIAIIFCFALTASVPAIIIKKLKFQDKFTSIFFTTFIIILNIFGLGLLGIVAFDYVILSLFCLVCGSFINLLISLFTSDILENKLLIESLCFGSCEIVEVLFVFLYMNDNYLPGLGIVLITVNTELFSRIKCIEPGEKLFCNELVNMNVWLGITTVILAIIIGIIALFGYYINIMLIVIIAIESSYLFYIKYWCRINKDSKEKLE